MNYTKKYTKYILLVSAFLFPLITSASTYEERAQAREIDRSVSSEEIQTLVEALFGPTSPMVDIIRCESHFRQFDASGVILRSYTDDVGIAQINIDAHGEEALRMGIDIYSIEGNLQFARYLFDLQGTLPWVCAKKV